MAGIDNNTLFYLRGDSLKDLSPNNISIVNQGTTIVDNSINLDSGYFTCNTGFKDINTTKYWTIEWWEYSTGASVGGSFLCNKPFTAGDGGGVIVGYYSNNGFYLGSTAGGWNGFDRTSIKDKVLNIWVHWALVRNGDNFVMYKNGVKYWNGTSSILPYAWDNNRFGIGMWYASGGIRFGYKANIKNFRISNIARYTEDFTPPTRPYNSITINKTNQTDTNIEFNIEKLGQETINKVEVLVNGTVSETYSDNYDSINYLIDTELCSIGNNKITIRVTFDDVYTEELSLTHTYTVDELPLETPLLDTVKRVKLLTKSKQYEKNMLSSILTSKNVEVTEEDKMSDLIGKVDLLGEYDDPILWLYKDGIENVVFEILGSGITIDKFHFTGSGVYASKKVSTNTIDLTSYKTLKVEYGNCTTTKGTSYYPVIGFGVATTKQTGDNHLTSKTASSSSYPFSNSNSISSLDISNINGLYYIDIYVNSYAGATLDININKIWLEK